jgi:folate-binding protein YgfZ
VSTAVDPGLEREYAQMAAGRAVARGPCALIWIEGPDAERFLQGLLSNDVAGLDAGEGVHALLLDVRGRIQTDLRVVADGPGAYTLVVARERGEALAEALRGYHFSEDLEIIGPEPSELITLIGVEPPGDAELVAPGTLPGTVDAVVADPETAMARLEAPTISSAALEIARVEAGVPAVGVDTGRRTLVHEAGLERRAVSFTKGCYLGQETVARVEHRGEVNRRLRGLRGGAAMRAGATVTFEGRQVGTVTTAVVSPSRGPIALAVLRREAAPGTTVEVEGAGPASVAALPFA